MNTRREKFGLEMQFGSIPPQIDSDWVRLMFNRFASNEIWNNFGLVWNGSKRIRAIPKSVSKPIQKKVLDLVRCKFVENESSSIQFIPVHSEWIRTKFSIQINPRPDSSKLNFQSGWMWDEKNADQFNPN